MWTLTYLFRNHYWYKGLVHILPAGYKPCRLTHSPFTDKSSIFKNLVKSCVICWALATVGFTWRHRSNDIIMMSRNYVSSGLYRRWSLSREPSMCRLEVSFKNLDEDVRRICEHHSPVWSSGVTCSRLRSQRDHCPCPLRVSDPSIT